MSTTRTVARGTARLLAGLLSAKALDFAFYLVLARRLGVEDFGRYTYAMSFTLLFTMMADLGVMMVFTREVSRAPHRVRALLAQVLRLKVGLAFATLAATVGISIAMGTPRETLALVALLTTAMLINSGALLFENILKASGRTGIAGITLVAQSATTIAVGLMLLFSGLGAVGGALAYGAGAVVHLAVAALCARDLWRQQPIAEGLGPAWPNWRALVRESAPLAISWAFIAIYFRIDSVLLNMFKGPAEVGLYGGAYRFFESFILLSAAYRSVLYPIMARTADGPSQALGVLCRKSLRLHLMFTVGVAVFMTFQARQVITVLLGPAYAGAAPALAILSWALPGAFMADTLFHLLAAQRRQQVCARTMGITAFFNVTANLAVIPHFSLAGAAAITVASELLSFALMYLAFRSTVPRIGLFGVARAPLVAGAIAGAALLLLAPLSPGGIAGLALMGTFAVSAYVLALVALGAIGRQDFELVLEVLPASLRPTLATDRQT